MLVFTFDFLCAKYKNLFLRFFIYFNLNYIYKKFTLFSLSSLKPHLCAYHIQIQQIEPILYSLYIFRNIFSLICVYVDLPLSESDFVHEHKHLSKLRPWTMKHVLTVYSPTHKEHKCFEPKSKRVCVTMDVTFV